MSRLSPSGRQPGAGGAGLCRWERPAPRRQASGASRLTPTLEAAAGGPAGCTPAPKGPAAAALGWAPGCLPEPPREAPCARRAARARCPTSGPRRSSRRLPRGDGAAAGRAAGSGRPSLNFVSSPGSAGAVAASAQRACAGSRAAGSAAPPGARGRRGERPAERGPAACRPRAATGGHSPSPSSGRAPLRSRANPRTRGAGGRGQPPGAALPGHGAAAPARCPARRGERGGPGGCGCLRGSAGGGHMRTSG